MKVRINNRKWFDYSIILFITLIISIPFLSKELDIYNNEGFYNIARAFETYKNFQINKGKILTTFFCYIGTADNILSGPLATFLFIIGNYFFNSYIVTYKLLVICLTFFSGIFMYKYVDKVTNKKNIVLLSSSLYILAPVHLNEIFVNNSINNLLILLFIPITFLGLYKLINTTELTHHVSIGIIGLILTDFKLAFLVGFGIIIYMIININSWSVEHSRKAIILNILFIVLITSFFTLPYFETINKTEYIQSSISKEEFLKNRLNIKQLFVTATSANIVYELGPHIIIMLAFSIMTFSRLKENRKHYIFFICMMIIYIFMSTQYFPWNLFPKNICNFNSPSVFLCCAIFFECVICGFNMDVVLKNFKVRDVLIISFISLIYVMALKDYIPYKDKIFEIEEYDLSEIYKSEFLPKKAYDNIDYINSRFNNVQIISGEAEIFEENKYLTHYNFKANSNSQKVEYELPYIYYPGYKISYDGIPMDYYESKNGLIAIDMELEKNTYFEIEYVGTHLANVTKIISFCSLCIFAYYVYKKH